MSILISSLYNVVSGPFYISISPDIYDGPFVSMIAFWFPSYSNLSVFTPEFSCDEQNL
jgi:hypothetical protein